jgi:hypothetical protein
MAYFRAVQLLVALRSLPSVAPVIYFRADRAEINGAACVTRTRDPRITNSIPTLLATTTEYGNINELIGLSWKW